MSQRATGTFTPSFEPLPSDDEAMGRARVTKRFEGDLSGTGSAEMLSVGTEVEGSAGYVAIDRIDGTLHGRQGTFVLQHSGLMRRGDGTLNVAVVPDSGTGELTGLSGEFDIQITDGEHRYTFDYAIEADQGAS
jgi:hypothetical protein